MTMPAGRIVRAAALGAVGLEIAFATVAAAVPVPVQCPLVPGGWQHAAEALLLAGVVLTVAAAAGAVAVGIRARRFRGGPLASLLLALLAVAVAFAGIVLLLVRAGNGCLGG